MTLATRKRETVSPEAWCHLIGRRCGLTFRETQIPAVLQYISGQMQASGAGDERGYYELLSAEQDGGPEWTALIEHLLNHETSFFRHPPSFEVVGKHILPELRDGRGRGSRLNFLSAGCSTGQEAYSLAMVAMLDDDLGNFTVWGADISRQAIDVARRGRYLPRAIAGVPQEYRTRFVRAIEDGATPSYEITEELRRRVRFSTANLIAQGGVNLNYDIIFCHNVLIYMAPPAVAKVVALLAARLTLGGYLMLGPGEGPVERPVALEPVAAHGVRMLRRRSTMPGEVRS
jgi:chemotaxis methyl-accepting protein methylase